VVSSSLTLGAGVFSFALLWDASRVIESLVAFPCSSLSMHLLPNWSRTSCTELARTQQLSPSWIAAPPPRCPRLAMAVALLQVEMFSTPLPPQIPLASGGHVREYACAMAARSTPVSCGCHRSTMNTTRAAGACAWPSAPPTTNARQRGPRQVRGMGKRHGCCCFCRGGPLHSERRGKGTWHIGVSCSQANATRCLLLHTGRGSCLLRS